MLFPVSLDQIRNECGTFYVEKRSPLEQIKFERYRWSASTTARAARNGWFRALRWACLNGCSYDERTFEAAAAGGHFRILRFLLAIQCPFDERAIRAAEAENHTAVVTWLKTLK